MSAAPEGDVSSMTRSTVPSSRASATRRPVSNVTPRSFARVTTAAVIEAEPPSATGQP